MFSLSDEWFIPKLIGSGACVVDQARPSVSSSSSNYPAAPDSPSGLHPPQVMRDDHHNAPRIVIRSDTPPPKPSSRAAVFSISWRDNTTSRLIASCYSPSSARTLSTQVEGMSAHREAGLRAQKGPVGMLMAREGFGFGRKVDKG
jgi:hypothetical protein